MEQRKHTTIWTNGLTDMDKAKVVEAVKRGELVRIGASCIGHTRAATVKAEGERFLKDELGLKEVPVMLKNCHGEDLWEENFWGK